MTTMMPKKKRRADEKKIVDEHNVQMEIEKNCSRENEDIPSSAIKYSLSLSLRCFIRTKDATC